MRNPVILIILGLLLFVAVLFWSFSDLQFTDDKWLRLTSTLLILAYLLVAFFNKRINATESFKYILIWVGIGLIIMSSYAYRYELSRLKERLLGEWSPASGREAEPGQMVFYQADDGHYYVNAVVDGVKIRFLVDTGASRVVLSARDATRLGYNLENLSYTMKSSTANGQVWTAPVRLKSIIVNSYTINDIPASINTGDLTVSLLGMSYLEKLKGYQVTKGGLVFHY